MSAQEEQESELEVLASIYEQHFHKLSTKSPHYFEIDLEGHATDNPHTAIACTLYFKYSLDYPNTAPLFEIRQPLGLLKDQTSELVVIISEVIERSLGMVMIFEIVSEVQQKLDEFTDTMVSNVQAQKEKNARLKSMKEAEAEQRVFTGTRVTVESFNAWNKAFLAEITAKKEAAAAEEDKKRQKQTAGPGGLLAASKRLTGREMFLRDNQFDESDLTFLAAEGGEIVEVDEKLFVDIGDIDLDDFPDIDDEADVQSQLTIQSPAFAT